MAIAFGFMSAISSALGTAASYVILATAITAVGTAIASGLTNGVVAPLARLKNWLIGKPHIGEVVTIDETKSIGPKATLQAKVNPKAAAEKTAEIELTQTPDKEKTQGAELTSKAVPFDQGPANPVRKESAEANPVNPPRVPSETVSMNDAPPPVPAVPSVPSVPEDASTNSMATIMRKLSVPSAAENTPPPVPSIPLPASVPVVSSPAPVTPTVATVAPPAQDQKQYITTEQFDTALSQQREMFEAALVKQQQLFLTMMTTLLPADQRAGALALLTGQAPAPVKPPPTEVSKLQDALTHRKIGDPAPAAPAALPKDEPTPYRRGSV
jgi:hypothetical protein